MSASAQAVACACGRRFQAPAQLAGKRVKCPACGGAIDVPQLVEALDSAELAWQSLPAANPLGHAAATLPQAARRPVPLALWIGLGVGAAALVLLLVVVIGVWTAGQRLFAQNRARALEQAAAGQGGGQVASAAGPQVYQSATGRFSVEFPGRPRHEFILNSEPGGLAHWEASLTIGEFLQGRGEQFLVTENPIGRKLTDEKIEAALTNLVNVTSGVDIGRGRVLTSVETSGPGFQGREVTYEKQTQQGGHISGRYRVLVTDREIISIEWVAAPAKAQTNEVTRFFDSFQINPKK